MGGSAATTAIGGTLVLKLVVTPLLIAAASLAGRRWGQAVGGWLVGLPLTSGPVAFFLALDHGVAFAAAAASGSLAGAVAEAGFGLAYAWSARRGWPAALAAACVVFALIAAALQRAAAGLVGLTALALVALWWHSAACRAARPARPPARCHGGTSRRAC
jgi:hypothetical protein